MPSHEHAVLRRTRTGDEGSGRLRRGRASPEAAPWWPSCYDDGIALVAENPSNTLRKISEIYDRIAFAGVGKYNEFDQLRVAGVRAADLKGYQYSRDDVDARSLANSYAQMLGQIFTHEMKPMEVEILVAEVGCRRRARISCSTSSTTARSWTSGGFSVLGGDAEAVTGRLNDAWNENLGLAEAVRVGVAALAGPDRTFGADDLEVAVLSRTNGRRLFARLSDEEVAAHLGAERATRPEW